jgi:iron complex outermembrane recepter protein
MRQNAKQVAAAHNFAAALLVFLARLGVNNLADKKPPVVGFTANPLLLNGNMVAGMYDAFGRYLFVGFTAKY